MTLVDGDDELAWIMTRYRQVHDMWHVLCGLPPTVLGEVALKWLELVQTRLPVAALSGESCFGAVCRRIAPGPVETTEGSSVARAGAGCIII